MTNILVVDDEIDSAESLALLFNACGHDTHLAFDGSQGLAQAKRYAPHIIFLDLDMPVLDGYAAAREIRATPGNDHPFIVALTGNADKDVEQRTLAAGFDFYMRKPANTNTLLALVADLGQRTNDGGH